MSKELFCKESELSLAFPKVIKELFGKNVDISLEFPKLIMHFPLFRQWAENLSLNLTIPNTEVLPTLIVMIRIEPHNTLLDVCFTHYKKALFEGTDSINKKETTKLLELP